jgi:NAD(P)-dependent dehydrogenase (short-subunit alcohol dehydrogenase family)
MSPDSHRFAGKVAVVTGVASGIGVETARRFLAGGASVALADRDEKAVNAVAKSLGDEFAEQHIWATECDVSEEDDAEAAMCGAIDRFGEVDILVNNAAVVMFKPLRQYTRHDWNSVLSVDLLGAFFFIKEAFLRMPQGGSIVNVSSVHAIETEPLVAAHAAAKAALVSLTKSASVEGREKGIRVNAVLPGATSIPAPSERATDTPTGAATGQTAIDRPRDVAAVIAFLASSDAAFIQGAAVLVDGGRIGHLV